MADIGNYAQHAPFWDFGGHDRTPEHAYWAGFAGRYGQRVLMPMCALAETGAYMARHGFDVTAFDITPEMVSEARRRFGGVANLSIWEGDVTSFQFDIPPADFCYSMDFGHLQTLEAVRSAFACIRGHLRHGGALVIETNLRLPGEVSSASPRQCFRPVRQLYPHLTVWKTGETHYDAETGRRTILQTFYSRDEDGNTTQFDHDFVLQGYFRGEWLEAFREEGFDVLHEHHTRTIGSWQSGGGGFCIFEAVKA